MEEPPDATARNIDVVEQFLAAFDRRCPADDDLAELVGPELRLIVRPNLTNPEGSESDAAAIRAARQTGQALLAWQSYEVRDHTASGDTVVTRMRWSGEIAIDAGPWPAGTRLVAWCVAHYRLADGRIVSIEQHDCYEQPILPDS